jgi:hypothetical protein
MNSKTTIIIFSILAITAAAAITITLMSTAKNNVLAQEQTGAADDGDLLIVQNTSMSAQDPVPGHESHQLALVAPPRQDGKIWSGCYIYCKQAC